MTGNKRSARGIRWLTALALTGALMAPIEAQGQILLPQRQCVFGEPFPSACATLLFIDFNADDNTVTLIVSNTTNAAENPGAVLAALFLEFNATPPALASTEASVEYGTFAGGVFVANGYSELWNIILPVHGNPGGFYTAWDLKIGDPSIARSERQCEEDDGVEICQENPGDLRVLPGDLVMITIEFEPFGEMFALADCGDDCAGRGWTARMQQLGPEGEDSGFTSVPEPSTVVLLATGLLGLGAVGLFRRRRSGV